MRRRMNEYPPKSLYTYKEHIDILAAILINGLLPPFRASDIQAAVKAARDIMDEVDAQVERELQEIAHANGV